MLIVFSFLIIVSVWAYTRLLIKIRKTTSMRIAVNLTKKHLFRPIVLALPLRILQGLFQTCNIQLRE